MFLLLLQFAVILLSSRFTKTPTPYEHGGALKQLNSETFHRGLSGDQTRATTQRNMEKHACLHIEANSAK